MNFSNILNEIAKADPEVFERVSERRNIIKNWTRRIGLTMIPFAVGSLFNKAYGKSTDTVIDILNFALTLEYLEREFYKKAINTNQTNPFIPASALPAIQTIYGHEAAHVDFLVAAIQGAGGTPVAQPTFDFSGGNGSNTGPFANAFSDYNLFLAVAQTFEDTGVRAYKGQAGGLMTDNGVLTAALNIHSVEARHAAHIRVMRKNNTGDPFVVGDTKPWITGNSSNIGTTAVQASYNGEDVSTQAGVNIASFVSMNAATESFDEPLTKAEVLAIVDAFIV
jgi:hypothetical protein